jgi:hypothetical protein
MAKKEPKIKELQPWDRRPWPVKGDADINRTYAAVGLFLSQWERYEGNLSILFSAFVSRSQNKAARRAYVSVRTFEGRADMLRAASSAYFDEHPDEKLQEAFKTVLKEATCFSPRRNDVAHGVVEPYIPANYDWVSALDHTHGLYPSYASFKDRDLADAPTYCYTSKELDYFVGQFMRLATDASRVADQLLKANKKP